MAKNLIHGRRFSYLIGVIVLLFSIINMHLRNNHIRNISYQCGEFAVNPAGAIKACPEAIQIVQKGAIPDKAQYGIIWLHLAHAHAGQNDLVEFERNSFPYLNKQWPSPILALYLKKITVAEVYEKANTIDIANKDDLSLLGNSGEINHQTCEANLYIGEWYLQNKDKDEARKAFKLANNICETDRWQRMIAQNELTGLAP
jgi:tetratricopeptide (TPR) repeat protein